MVLVPGHSLMVIVCPDIIEGNGGVMEASCHFCGLRPTGTMKWNFLDMSPDTDSCGVLLSCGRTQDFWREANRTQWQCTPFRPNSSMLLK